MRLPLGHGPGRSWLRYLGWLGGLAVLLSLYAFSWILLLQYSG